MSKMDKVNQFSQAIISDDPDEIDPTEVMIDIVKQTCPHCGYPVQLSELAVYHKTDQEFGDVVRTLQSLLIDLSDLRDELKRIINEYERIQHEQRYNFVPELENLDERVEAVIKQRIQQWYFEALDHRKEC